MRDEIQPTEVKCLTTIMIIQSLIIITNQQFALKCISNGYVYTTILNWQCPSKMTFQDFKFGTEQRWNSVIKTK